MEKERKFTSINMKVSSQLHNQRTTMAEQNYILGALLHQRPLQNNRTPYIYSKAIFPAEACSSFHGATSSQLDYGGIPLSDTTSVSMGFAGKIHPQGNSELTICLHGESFLAFHSWAKLRFQLPAPTSINWFIEIIMRLWMPRDLLWDAGGASSQPDNLEAVMISLCNECGCFWPWEKTWQILHPFPTCDLGPWPIA